MMTRDNAVELAIELAKSHSHLILNWATGVGKSKASLSIAAEFQPPRILLIVAEIAHKSNWEAEFNKWEKGQLWSNTTTECYASLKNYRGTEWDLVILDEGHHAKSELRMDILSTLKAKRVVVLTATLSTEDEALLNSAFGVVFKKSTITLQEAISWGILPAPKVYLVPLELNSIQATETIEESWGDSSKRVNITIPFERRFTLYKSKKSLPAVNLTLTCTESQKYDYLTEKVEYFKRQFMIKRQEFLKNKWMQLGSARKRMLADSKTPILKTLLEKLNKRRFICFCGSITQAELLGGDTAIHSKKKGSLKIIEKFNNKEINNILAVNMLQEGQNLQGIEVGVIAQLDGQERAFIQKFGRTLRADDPIQIILYFRNTRDEEYLHKAIEDINPQYIQTVQDFSEINL